MGLPGSPVAAVTVREVFDAPLVTALQAADPAVATPAHAVLAEPRPHKPGRAEDRHARITSFSGGELPAVNCPHGAAVGHAAWLGIAEGVVCVSAVCRAISPGEQVAFRPFRRPD